jgi:hypothetical protein
MRSAESRPTATTSGTGSGFRVPGAEHGARCRRSAHQSPAIVHIRVRRLFRTATARKVSDPLTRASHMASWGRCAPWLVPLSASMS